MRLLALDQSSRCNGFAVFEDDQLVKSGTFTLRSDDVGERLVDYRKHIEKLIIDNDIEEVAFEDIQMQGQVNNVQTFKVLAEIFGVTQEFLVENGHSYHIVSSNTWKSKLQIKGRTRVEQKRNAQIYVLENFDKKVSQDESDAICIGASIVLDSKKNKADFNWS